MTKATCSVEGCEREAAKRGFCGMHYQRVKKHGSAGAAESRRHSKVGTCSVDNCNRQIFATGRCRTHYNRYVRDGFDNPFIAPRRDRVAKGRFPCRVDGCTVGARFNGMCQRHYHRLLTYGDPLFIPPRYKIGHPTGVISIDREALAWAAGFYDGEGCTHLSFSSPRADGSRSYSPSMTIAQTDRRVLERFQRALTGMGSIDGPFQKKNPKWNQTWVWRISSYERTAQVICLLWPWLDEIKQEQATNVLSRYLKSQANRRRSPAGYVHGIRRD